MCNHTRTYYFLTIGNRVSVQPNSTRTILGLKPSLCSAQIPHGLYWDCNRASVQHKFHMDYPWTDTESLFNTNSIWTILGLKPRLCSTQIPHGLSLDWNRDSVQHKFHMDYPWTETEPLLNANSIWAILGLKPSLSTKKHATLMAWASALPDFVLPFLLIKRLLKKFV
jgi:hypothetical protein